MMHSAAAGLGGGAGKHFACIDLAATLTEFRFILGAALGAGLVRKII